jgi:Na+/proline symporter
MSTISSSLNALAAASTHDLWLPLTRRLPDDAGLLRVGRRFTLAWAAVLIGGALLYRAEGTPVVVIALSVASFTYGAMLGGFFLGLVVRGARQPDAITGMTIGLVAMAFVVFGRQVQAVAPWLPVLPPIAWPWYVLIGTTITVLAGAASSRIRLTFTTRDS